MQPAEEFIPLTSDQDGSNLETSSSLGSLVAGASATDSPVLEDGSGISTVLNTVNTEPAISRSFGLELEDGHVTRLSFLHDEVSNALSSDSFVQLSELSRLIASDKTCFHS